METDILPNLETICRLCLGENVANINIFKTTNLCLRIMTSTSLEVHSGDGLPVLICIDCRLQLEKSYMFRKKCQISDSKLRKHIRLINGGKRSKVFQTSETEQEEENLEFEESLKFISNFETEQEKMSEEKRQIREMEICENAKIEETNRLLDEFKNFILLKTETKSSNLNSNTIVHNPIEDPLIPKSYNVNSMLTKKNLLVFDENNEPNELIFVVANPEDEDNINLNEYDIEEEENYDSDFDGNSKSFENNETDSDVNQILKDTNCLNETDDVLEINNSLLIDDAKNNFLQSEKTENINIELQNPKKSVCINRITRGNHTRKSKREVLNSTNSNNKDAEIKIQKISNLHMFKCNLCPQSFTRRRLLERHSSVHLKKKNYCCGHCKKLYACKSSLDRHARIHTGEKPFECEHCGKKFNQREILKRHLHLHTGQKPFRCNYCHQSFVQKQVLQNHINIKHTENSVIKTHDCFLCPKTFMHASGLSRHLLLHSGTSYECSECNKKFNDKSALKRHTNAVHCVKIKSENSSENNYNE